MEIMEKLCKDLKPIEVKGTTETRFKFMIAVEMKDRWVPHFLAMLKYMEYLGNIGSSRMVSLYADGDGDFRPKFYWHESLPFEVKPIKDENGDKTWDAG